MTEQQNRYPLLSEAAGRDLYYDKKVNRWTHVHVNFYDGYLVKIAPDKVQCQTCERVFLLTPPPEQWDSQRDKRVDEVMRRLRATDHPKAWECIFKTPGDGRIYRIVFDDLVHQWECTCRDYRDYACRFWKCKHIRAVER